MKDLRDLKDLMMHGVQHIRLPILSGSCDPLSLTILPARALSFSRFLSLSLSLSLSFSRSFSLGISLPRAQSLVLSLTIERMQTGIGHAVAPHLGTERGLDAPASTGAPPTHRNPPLTGLRPARPGQAHLGMTLEPLLGFTALHRADISWNTSSELCTSAYCLAHPFPIVPSYPHVCSAMVGVPPSSPPTLTYVVPCSEFPIVPSFLHVWSAMVGVPNRLLSPSYM